MALALTDDWSRLAQLLFTGDTWLVLLVVMAFGMIGGWAHRLGSPKDDETTLLAYLVLGAVAALGSLWVIDPEKTHALKLIAFAVIAGYAGKAVMSSLQARVEAATAKEATKKANEQKDEAIKVGKEATVLARQITEQAGREKSAATQILVDAKDDRVNLVLPKLWAGVKRDPISLMPNWEAHNAPRLEEVAALDARLDMLGRGIV
jgi:hypothetical protein